MSCSSCNVLRPPKSHPSPASHAHAQRKRSRSGSRRKRSRSRSKRKRSRSILAVSQSYSYAHVSGRTFVLDSLAPWADRELLGCHWKTLSTGNLAATTREGRTKCPNFPKLAFTLTVAASVVDTYLVAAAVVGGGSEQCMAVLLFVLLVSDSIQGSRHGEADGSNVKQQWGLWIAQRLRKGSALTLGSLLSPI